MTPAIATIAAIQPSLRKIIVTDAKGEVTVGTGMIVAPGNILTCAHVIMGHPRLDLLLRDMKKQSPKVQEKTLWKRRLGSIKKMVIDDRGTLRSVKILLYDTAKDTALLHVEGCNGPALEMANMPFTLGQEVYLCGFGYTIQTKPEKWPFTVYPGMVSSFLRVKVGGTKRRSFVAIAGTSFGGCSGGPIIDRESGKVIGMIHGHMLWGRDDVLIRDASKPDKVGVGNTDSPIPVTFGTEGGN